jgi:pimeloyl-ACP methyl ester carboxylesterase
VQLWSGGADDGPLVLVSHGTPDTRWVARTGAEAARVAGVRLLCLNRPGYGASTAATTTPASVADDAMAVLDQRGEGPVAVLGMSVGGLYAAALAARHPERVAVLGLVASPLAAPDPAASFGPEFEAWSAGIDPADPDDEALAARWLRGLPAADAALLSGLGTSGVAASVREALAQPDGYLCDAETLLGEWGFAPEDVRVPTHLWYGADDDRNPPATGRWWAERIAGSRFVVRPATTHLATLLAHWPDVLTTLFDHL